MKNETFSSDVQTLLNAFLNDGASMVWVWLSLAVAGIVFFSIIHFFTRLSKKFPIANRIFISVYFGALVPIPFIVSDGHHAGGFPLLPVFSFFQVSVAFAIFLLAFSSSVVFGVCVFISDRAAKNLKR